MGREEARGEVAYGMPNLEGDDAPTDGGATRNGIKDGWVVEEALLVRLELETPGDTSDADAPNSGGEEVVSAPRWR